MEGVEEAVNQVTELGESLKKSIADVNADLRKEFEKFEGQLKENGKVSADTLEQFKGIEKKISEMEKKHGEEVAALATKMNRPDFGKEKEVRVDLEGQIYEALKSLNESGFYSGIKGDKTVSLDKGQAALSLKVVGDMSNTNLSNGYTSRRIETSIVHDPSNPDRIRDIIGITSLNAPSWEYPEETGSEGAVGTQTEGSGKSQIDFDLTMRTTTPLTFAVYARTTKQSIDDIAGLANYLASRLRDKWFDYEDNQIINGPGTTGNFAGIVNKGTAYVKTGGVGDVYYEYLIDAVSQLQEKHYRNISILVNPLDFMKLLIYKATTSGEYTHPSLAYGPDGIYRIFGTQIRANSAVTRLTGIAGDFKQAVLGVREGLNLAASFEEGSNFTSNKVTYRLEGREALAIYQPKAFRIINFATISS